jgi:hypothetical protein
MDGNLDKAVSYLHICTFKLLGGAEWVEKARIFMAHRFHREGD